MLIFLLKYWFEFKLTGLLPESIQKKIQLKKLNRLLNKAYTKTGFYKEHYKDLSSAELKIKNFEDFNKLPYTSKEIFKTYPYEQLLTTESTKIPTLIKRSTSGSTGKPFDTYLTRKEYFTSYLRTFFSLKGYNPFKKFVLIGIFKQKEEIERKSFLYYFQKYLNLFRRETISVYTPIDEVIAKLKNGKINILSSTPTFLQILCEELAEKNQKLSVDYVVPFGETLLPSQKKQIQEYLRAKVIDVYGCMEHPTFAWTKPDGNIFYYPLNSLIVEYTNVIEIEGEKYGELVLTNLINHTMPFIRYKISDRVKIIDGKYGTMGKIEGRIEDIIHLNNNEKLFRLQIWNMFNGLKECKQYKLLQKKDMQIFFLAILKEGYEKDMAEEKIGEIWNKNFPNQDLNIQFVNELPVDPKTGKFKNIEIEK